MYEFDDSLIFGLVYPYFQSIPPFPSFGFDWKKIVLLHPGLSDLFQVVLTRIPGNISYFSVQNRNLAKPNDDFVNLTMCNPPSCIQSLFVLVKWPSDHQRATVICTGCSKSFLLGLRNRISAILGPIKMKLHTLIDRDRWNLQTNFYNDDISRFRYYADFHNGVILHRGRSSVVGILAIDTWRFFDLHERQFVPLAHTDRKVFTVEFEKAYSHRKPPVHSEGNCS